MEIKEAERVVVAKPIPSRPSCSTLRSFSELLADAIEVSPHNETSKTAITVAPIRPKTVRFKPTANPAPAGFGSSLVETSGVVAYNSSDTIPKSKPESNRSVLYRPLAKLVSKTTVSLLAKMGKQSTEGGRQYPMRENHGCRTHPSSNLHQITTSVAHTKQTSEPSKMASPSQEMVTEDSKALANSDRPSYDGYNWRKYGQKQVKGSEYPRSYYKCTHPNCPVKKKVERSVDGQIAEIVYKGEHNHSKPQLSRRNITGTQGAGLVSDRTAQDTNNNPSIPWRSNHKSDQRNEGSEGRVETQNDVGVGLSSYMMTNQGKSPLYKDSIPVLENSCGQSEECEEGSKRLEAEEDEPHRKRRKSENQSSEAGVSEGVLLEPRVVVQSSSDYEIMNDGFRWRKYGQKVVKGNPYPRSYYRCTNTKCNARKHVERASDDPRAFITTYEGKHNHEMPLRNTSAVASETDLQAPSTSQDKP